MLDQWFNKIPFKNSLQKYAGVEYNFATILKHQTQIPSISVNTCTEIWVPNYFIFGQIYSLQTHWSTIPDQIKHEKKKISKKKKMLEKMNLENSDRAFNSTQKGDNMIDNRLLRHREFVSKYIWGVTCDFQQCGIFTSIDSDESVQPHVKLRTSKWCLVSSLTIIESAP